MSYIQNYPLLTPIIKIVDHNQLPNDVFEIARLKKGSSNYDPCYVFLKSGNNLSILIAYTMELTTGDKYVCHQYDFPLKALSWFPKALEAFKKPPAQGGLHAGAMISKDEDVDGEMLAIGSTTRGYNITNWSRHAKGVDANPNFYRPTALSLDSDLLYDYGLLKLWKSLGEKYENGEFQ